MSCSLAEMVGPFQSQVCTAPDDIVTQVIDADEKHTGCGDLDCTLKWDLREDPGSLRIFKDEQPK